MYAIKKVRESAGLSQQDVADALGIKKPRYGDWERETTQINLRDAIRLCDLFGEALGRHVSLDELAGRKAPPAQVPSLSENEARVVDAMRNTDARGRATIVRTAEGEVGMEAQRLASGQ